MALEKTEAVVLKSQDLGETSKIITLYTRKSGKIQVVAKGARGLKSRFYGSLEVINHISLVYYYKENRDLQLLSQADIVDSYKGIRKHLYKYSLASIADEMIIRSEYAEEANPGLFSVLLDFLKNLDISNENFDNYLYWFQLKFLELAGFEPKLDGCVVCGQGRTGPRLFFSVAGGGYVCEACGNEETTGIFISADVVKYMLLLNRTAPDALREIDSTQQTLRECATVLNQFMQYHIPGLGYIKSIKFLKHMIS